MAGYLGSLNSFHSFRDKKGAAGTSSGHVDVPPQARRNVYRMEKQSPQRFTTGILTQQENRGEE